MMGRCCRRRRRVGGPWCQARSSASKCRLPRGLRGSALLLVLELLRVARAVVIVTGMVVGLCSYVNISVRDREKASWI